MCLFVYKSYNSKTICVILLKLIPYIRYEILHFILFYLFSFIPYRKLFSLSHLVGVQRNPALP